MFSKIAETFRSLTGTSKENEKPPSRKRRLESGAGEPSAKRLRYTDDSLNTSVPSTPSSISRWFTRSKDAFKRLSVVRKMKSMFMNVVKDFQNSQAVTEYQHTSSSYSRKQVPPYYSQANVGAVSYNSMYSVDQGMHTGVQGQNHGVRPTQPMVARYNPHSEHVSFMVPSGLVPLSAGDARMNMPRGSSQTWSKNPRPVKVPQRYDYKTPVGPGFMSSQPIYRPVHDRIFSQSVPGQHRNTPAHPNPGHRNRSGVSEAFRLHEKQRYADLLQSMTSVPLTPAARPNSQHMLNRSIFNKPQVKETVLGTKVENLTASAASQQPSSNVIVIDSDSSQSTLFEENVVTKPSINLAKIIQRQKAERARSSFDDYTPFTRHLVPRSDLKPPAPPKLEFETPRHTTSSRLVAELGSKSPKMQEFETTFKQSKYTSDDWLNNIVELHNTERIKRDRAILEEKVKRDFYKDRTDELERDLQIRIKQRLRLSEREPALLAETFDEEEEEEEEEEIEFPDLGEEAEGVIDAALRPYPPNEVLVEGFRLRITRTDMATLSGLNWLNDEVINFYMELIKQRSEQGDLPKIHAFNTFFYPRISKSGQQSVRRWTKNVNIFEKDCLIVPIHLGMHWCLAVVDFRKKSIAFYDSMLGRGDDVLRAVKQYLIDEKLDKLKEKMDMSEWQLITVKEIPQQMNGSDCGVFTCKYADYISKDKKITFTQSNMPYFRRRMVYEILSKQLMS